MADKKDEIRGISFGIVAGTNALIKKYDLPRAEASQAFSVAFAEALALYRGKDAEEMFGEPYTSVRDKGFA